LAIVFAGQTACWPNSQRERDCSGA
jgi:hypothetical protein